MTATQEIQVSHPNFMVKEKQKLFVNLYIKVKHLCKKKICISNFCMYIFNLKYLKESVHFERRSWIKMLNELNWYLTKPLTYVQSHSIRVLSHDKCHTYWAREKSTFGRVEVVLGDLVCVSVIIGENTTKFSKDVFLRMTR